MMNAILLNDTQHWYHYGCHFTSSGLKALIAERYRLIDAVAIHELFALRPPMLPNDFARPAMIDELVAAHRGLFDRIALADVVVVNGEGSLHGLTRPVLTLLWVIAASRLVLGKPVFIVNHSAYPDDREEPADRVAIDLYRRAYALADYVAVREVASHALMRGLGVRCELSFDCSVLAIDSGEERRRERVVAVGGAAGFDATGTTALARWLHDANADGWRCKFVHGAPERPARDDERFLAALRAAATPLESTLITGPEQFTDELGSAGLVVSGRFHYSIAAYALGTPFVLWGSNTPKNTGLSVMLGAPPPLPWNAPDLFDRLGQAAGAANASDGERRQQRLAALRQLARRNLP